MADYGCKCKNCGRIYTHRPRYTKLTRAKHKETARLFWLSVSAAAAARAVGLSAKTVSKWFNRLRERIAADHEAARRGSSCPSAVTASIWSVLSWTMSSWTRSSSPTAGSDGWKVDNRLSLNGFHHKRINHDKTLANGKVHINGPESSRGYAKGLSRWLQTQRQALYP